MFNPTGQQPSAAPLSNSEGKKPVQVVETGSARPVQEPTKNQQQLTNTNTNQNQNQGQQPFVNQQPNKTPPVTSFLITFNLLGAKLFLKIEAM